MKKVFMVGTILTVCLSSASGQKKEAALKSQKEKFSYSVGLDIGRNMKQRSSDLVPDLLIRGIRDALTGAKPLLTDKEIEETMTKYQSEMISKQAELATKNRKLGEQFLAENRKNEGVVTLVSGLQYKVLRAGTGPKPTKDQTAECNYRGTLIDGKEFDSSYKRGQSITFNVGQMIKGWGEAFQLMPVGSKWQLFIPADLAYGDRGNEADIEPGMTIVFEVELLSIK